MAWVKRVFTAVMIVLILMGVTARNRGFAADNPEDPIRQTQIIVSYTKYEWWLVGWSDNQPLCQIIINHEGWPTASEIYSTCGKVVYAQWKTTPSCELTDDLPTTTSCVGLYLHLVSTEPAEKTILVDLPLPQVFITLAGCSPTTPENRCSQLPSLLLVGDEPLPNEHITAIHATMNGQTTSCEGTTCQVPPQPTPLEGTTIEFWADSSYGDSSQHFTALVRVIETGVSPAPGNGGWYVDVLSTQWRGKQIASCAQDWHAFPPIGGPPTWLTTPEIPELLATDESYYFLAGRLISQGLVNASDCPGGGLLANGYADACGLDKAKTIVQEWQNRFDNRIIDVAKETGVPAQLLKNLFAAESQFWPGAFKDPKEYGLGQLTENGAETILLWNPTFYEKFCPLILNADACKKGYVYLNADNQATLRGALSLEAKADCPDCTAGIDLTNADFSISLFAQTLLANCDQVGQIVYNATNRIAGTVSNYEDLWRFTIANYHAGPGCLSYAIYSAWQSNDKMDWEHVSKYLTPPCQGVTSYIDKIAR